MTSMSPGRGRTSSRCTSLVREDASTLGPRAVVLVAYGDPLPAPMTLEGLHVVPAGWVSARRPVKKIPQIDLAWSWKDVIDLAATRGVDA